MVYGADQEIVVTSKQWKEKTCFENIHQLFDAIRLEKSTGKDSFTNQFKQFYKNVIANRVFLDFETGNLKIY